MPARVLELAAQLVDNFMEDPSPSTWPLGVQRILNSVHFDSWELRGWNNNVEDHQEVCNPGQACVPPRLRLSLGLSPYICPGSSSLWTLTAHVIEQSIVPRTSSSTWILIPSPPHIWQVIPLGMGRGVLISSPVYQVSFTVLKS